MTEHALYRLHVDDGGDGERRGGVPQLVRTEGRQSITAAAGDSQPLRNGPLRIHG